MILFGGILLAHLLYDFHWQGPFIADNKGQRPFLLIVHALTWALLIGAVLWAFGALLWWHVPFLFATHAVVDYWKARQPRTPDTFYLIYIDQCLHLVTMVVVVL
jgi:hypothetical protein